MTTQSSDPNQDKALTDAAWRKLQNKLAAEPVNPKWTAWPGPNVASAPSAAPESPAEQAPRPNHTRLPEALQAESTPARASVPAIETEDEVRRNRRKTRTRRWMTVAAACCVLGAIVATPVGNKALAAILNQFRMQEVTVVDENELRHLFNSVTENGKTEESLNQFGTFTNTIGPERGPLKREDAQNKLGYNLLPTSVIGTTSLYIGASQTLTINLHVDAVNKAMKRLGATKLMPDSVDGKPITFTIPESVHYQMNDGKDKYADLMQTNVPTVTVDPSIKVEEALDAVLQFPLLPDHLKSSLKKSRILSGDIPLPIIATDRTEKLSVGGTPVIMEAWDYKDGSHFTGTWVKNGQLFSFSGGSMYPSREAFLAKIKELIGS